MYNIYNIQYGLHTIIFNIDQIFSSAFDVSTYTRMYCVFLFSDVQLYVSKYLNILLFSVIYLEHSLIFMKNNCLKFSRGLWKLLVFAVKSSVNSEHPQGGNWSLTPNIVLKEMSKTYLSQNILFNFMSQKLSFFLVPTFFYQADRKNCCVLRSRRNILPNTVHYDKRDSVPRFSTFFAANKKL